MLVVTRFVVGSPDGAEPDAPARTAANQDARDVPGPDGEAERQFRERAEAALAAFAACPGFTDGRLGRSADDPRWWCLITDWASVGAYRRALSNFQVRMTATPLLAEAVEEPSAFEVLADTDGGDLRRTDSDRAGGDRPPT